VQLNKPQLLLLDLINFLAFSEFDLNLGCATSSTSIVAIAAGSIDLCEIYYGGKTRFSGAAKRGWLWLGYIIYFA